MSKVNNGRSTTVPSTGFLAGFLKHQQYDCWEFRGWNPTQLYTEKIISHDIRIPDPYGAIRISWNEGFELCSHMKLVGNRLKQVVVLKCVEGVEWNSYGMVAWLLWGQKNLAGMYSREKKRSPKFPNFHHHLPCFRPPSKLSKSRHGRVTGQITSQAHTIEGMKIIPSKKPNRCEGDQPNPTHPPLSHPPPPKKKKHEVFLLMIMEACKKKHVEVATVREVQLWGWIASWAWSKADTKNKKTHLMPRCPGQVQIHSLKKEKSSRAIHLKPPLISGHLLRTKKQSPWNLFRHLLHPKKILKKQNIISSPPSQLIPIP